MVFNYLNDLFIQVTKNKKEQSFYSLPEFEEWKASTDNWHTYKIKYYKGIFSFSDFNVWKMFVCFFVFFSCFSCVLARHCERKCGCKPISEGTSCEKSDSRRHSFCSRCEKL